MSTSLYWAPPPKETKEHGIGLKYEIARFYDEFYNGDSCDLGLCGSELIPFLKGLIVGGCSDYDSANELLEAIQKHGQVQLYIREWD